MIKRLLYVLLLLLPSISLAADFAYLTAMRIQPGMNKTTVEFTLTRKTYGRVKYMPSPHRLLVEFADTQKRFTINQAKLVGANVTTVNAGNVSDNKVQIVFGLLEKVRWTTRFLPADESKRIRFRLEIVSTSKQKQKPVVVTPVPVASSAKKRLFTVVIDPGHGGKDSGAIGRNGTREKDVVLAVSKEIARIINQSANMRAVLTRDDDRYLRLRERLRLARKKDADVFVAIHADAFYKSHARGSSVFAVSQRAATSEAARWLAQQDNHSELGGVALNALQDQSMLLRSVLIDMAQTATIQDSVRLGAKMLAALKNVTTLHYKQVEQAPFLVLKSPDIPSILIETGFITNPSEEQRLNDPRYQRQLAQAIYKGLAAYMAV